MLRSWARARTKVRALFIAALAVGPWLVPGAPSATVQAAPPAAASPTGCGGSWGAATKLGSLPGPLLEISGFVSSAKYPGVAWMQQDSDNPNRIFSFRLVDDKPEWKPFTVPGVHNYDWEDIAYSVGSDGVGRIWILENTDEVGEKKIFEVREPNPDTDKSAQLLGTYRLNYQGGAINTEAMFALPGKLVFTTKTQHNAQYELDLPLSKSGVNVAHRAGSLEDTGAFVTGTGTSAGNQLLMSVSAGDYVAVFQSPHGELSEFLGQDPIFRRSIPDIQFESGDFFPYNSCDILILCEDGTVWRLSNPGKIRAFGTPDSPSAVTVVPGNGGATVSWAAPQAGEAPHAYRVVAFDGPTEVASVVTHDGLQTSAFVSGLLNDHPYTFAVAAMNSAGEGPMSPSTAPVSPSLNPAPGPATPTAPFTVPSATAGYWMLGSDGSVFGFGNSRPLGQPTLSPGAGATDLEPTPSAAGYWTLDASGRVSAFGDAMHRGDVGPARLLAGERTTSLSRTPTGAGYWVFTSRGRAFAFGDAPVLGDMTGVALNGAVLDSVATPTGRGYYMVGSDGGIFAFGDAVFRGSMGGQRLNAPIRSLVPTRDGSGYWLVAADGGVFGFGAPFRGSMAGRPLNAPVTGMVRFGDGYLMVGEDGGIFNFSDAPFLGSLGAKPPAHPIVAVAPSV